MGLRGPKCPVCIAPNVTEIDANLMVLSLASCISKYKPLTRDQLDQHKRQHVAVRLGINGPTVTKVDPKPGPKVPTYPVLGAEATPLERSEATCVWLRARIDYAGLTGAPEKEIIQLAGQLTNANRLHARLSGALDITEAQIVRSAPWARILVVIRDVLKTHPKALREVAEAIEALAEGER